MAADVIADRTHEMRLAQSRPAVDEERIVHGAWRLGDGAGGGNSEPVGGADDEVVEAVAGIDLHGGYRVGWLNRLSTSSEMLRSVSNTPGPCSASAPNSGAARKFSASFSSAGVRIR